MIKLSWPRRTFPSFSSSLSLSSRNKSFQDLTLEISNAIRSSSSFSETQKIHARLIRTGLRSSLFLLNTLLHSNFSFDAAADACRLFYSMCSPNTVTHNIMVTGLAKSGRLENARKVFDEIPIRDSASWNSLMSGYFHHDRFEETIEIFASLVGDPHGQLDVFSLTIAMKAGGALQTYELGLQLHVLVEKLGFGRDAQIKRSLIDMHIKCGAADMAASVFERMERPDLFCWNSMILGYLRLYGVEHALRVFNCMPERDIISWNTIVSGLSQNGRCWETLSMIINMQAEGYKDSSIAYTCGLNACTHIPHLDWGMHLHARILKSEPSIDVFVGSALVDMYAKCGYLEAAKRTFESLNNHNAVLWTSLIGGFAQCGNAKEALKRRKFSKG